MRRIASTLLALAILLPLSAQATASDADTSYAFGMYMAALLKSTGLEVSVDDVAMGFSDSLAGKGARFSEVQAQSILQQAIAGAAAKVSETNLAKGQAFLDANRAKAGVKVTASGLQYEVLRAGSGQRPKATDTVTVNYEGRLLDGSVFDSSYERGEPATFALNQVIKGWTEGVQLMPVGSKYRFYIPSELAYGAQGAGEDIGPNSTLVFDVELLSVKAN